MRKTLILSALILSFAVINFAQKAEPLEIKFAKGKSSKVLMETLSNDQQMEYVFAAKAGQKVSLKVTSKPSGKFFDFTLAGDGFDFQTEYDSYSDYSFTAPQTGNYFLNVRKRPTGANKTAKFYLTLTIR